MFEAHKDDTWPQVEAEADEVVATLTARVAALDERDLSDPDRFAWAAGEALVAPVLSNAVWHPYGHIVDFYRAHGDQARVAALHEALTREMGALDEWPALRTHALSRYNLACLSALGGETARALNLIGKALQLDPGLMENAREDHDLDPLRGDPTFAAMLASGTAS